MKKEILTAELVNESGIEGNGRKLFYKLSHKIKRGQVPFHNDDIVKSLEEDKEFLLKKEYLRFPTVIGGENTFSMSDGARFSMKEPEFYLKELAELNGFKWGGIK